MISRIQSISVLLLVIFLQCISSSIIRELTFVSTFDGVELQPIQDGDVINLASPTFDNKNLTVLLQLNPEYDASKVSRVVFDLDNGRLERWITTPPFVLGGSYLENGVELFYEVLRLQQLGTHILKVFVTYDNSANLSLLADDTVTVSFTTEEVVIVPVAPTVPTPTVPPELSDFPSMTPAIPTDVQGVEPTVDIPDFINNSANEKVTVLGTKEKLSPVTFVLRGIDTVEYDRENPFLNLRASINITDPNGITKIIPGYYASDGNASNSGEWTGDVWLAHYTPAIIGKYTYRVSYVRGTDAAIKDEYFVPFETTAAGYFNTASGTLDIVSQQSSTSPSKGFLKYDGTHYLKYSEDTTGTSELGFGLSTDGSILSYYEFDYNDSPAGLFNAKFVWDEYVSQFVPGSQPTWAGGKGKGLMGLLNQISKYDANSVTVSVYSPSDNVFPFNQKDDMNVLDCSKLAQWDIVFEYLSSQGTTINVKLVPSSVTVIDNEWRLFFREMIARFSHYEAIVWNIGFVTDSMQTLEAAKIIRELDPYQHPIFVSYSNGGGYDVPTDALVGDINIDGISLVYTDTNGANIYNDIVQWTKKTGGTGKPWVVTFERDGDIVGSGTPKSFRQNVVWGTLMAGAGGLDFNSLQPRQSYANEKFDERTLLLRYVKDGMKFFESNSIMLPDKIYSNQKLLVSIADQSNLWTLSNSDDSEHVVYVKDTAIGPIGLDFSSIPAAKTCTVRWYCPISGGPLLGGITFVGGSSNQSIGMPPSETSPRRSQDDKDWVLLIQCAGSTLENALMTLESTTPINEVVPIGTLPRSIYDANTNGKNPLLTRSSFGLN